MSRRVPMTKERWQELKERWINDHDYAEMTVNDAVCELLDEAEAARENEAALYEAQEQEPQYHCSTCRCGTDGDFDDYYR